MRNRSRSDLSFSQVFGYNPANCLLNNLQTIRNHLESGMTVFCQQTTNRFHIFVCSGSRRTTTSGIVLHVLPSVSKASIPPTYNSTTHGSATISLINQFVFTALLPALTQNLIATLCSSMTLIRQKIFTCKTSSYSQTTERKLLMPGHVLHEAQYYVVTVSAAKCNAQYSFKTTRLKTFGLHLVC